MSRPWQNPISRRTALKAGLAGVASTALPAFSFAEDAKVVVALWAGASADAMKKIYGEAFSGSGITLEFDESGPEPAKVRSMVEAGQVTWDIADLSVADSTLLGKAGFARAIDYNIVPKDSVIPGFAYEYAVASYLFSSIISYDKKALGDNVPTGWADFWNVEKFPGKRAMYKHIEGTLEAALVADGVPIDQIYPIDEDRAFAKLKEILPHAIFWNSGSESQQLMRDGETVLGNLWSTRATQLATEEKDRFALDFTGGLLLPSKLGRPGQESRRRQGVRGHHQDARSRSSGKGLCRDQPLAVQSGGRAVHPGGTGPVQSHQRGECRQAGAGERPVVH